MRTFEEINAEIRTAIAGNNAQSLRVLAVEMIDLATPTAEAAAETAMGFADLRTGESDAALEHFERALALYEQLGDLRGSASIYGNTGLVYQSQGRDTEALQYFERALQEYEELGDRHGVATSVGNIGIVYLHLGDHAKALVHYERALRMHEELNDFPGVARLNGNLGTLYHRTADYPRSLQYYERACALNDMQGNHFGLAICFSGMAVVYAMSMEPSKALEYAVRALALHEELNDRFGASLVTGNIGNMYGDMGDFARAREWLARSITAQKELGHEQGVANAMVNMSRVLLAAGEYEQAHALLHEVADLSVHDPEVRCQIHMCNARIAEHNEDLDVVYEHLNSALSIASRAGMRSVLADVHHRLRDLAQHRNDFAGYIEHNIESQRITDEIRGQEATRKLAMIEAEKRIESERKEKEKHKALLYNTLPPSIADRVLRGETVNDTHDIAAVMFLDMVGFTVMSSTMEPNDVVSLLSQIFTICDAIMAEHGMMKIKTIGDSYMAVAISNTRDQTTKTEQTGNNEVNSAAKAAVQVLSALSEQHPEIHVRIGLHCGPVTAGVIGTQRLQYDVWGDTVNVASRMESTGEPGKIHVSETFASFLAATRNDSSPDSLCEDSTVIPSGSEELGTWHEERGTWHVAPDMWHLTVRGEIEVRGKGPMTTYWLETK